MQYEAAYCIPTPGRGIFSAKKWTGKDPFPTTYENCMTFREANQQQQPPPQLNAGKKRHYYYSTQGYVKVHTQTTPPLLLIPNPVYTGSPSSSSFLLCHLRRCRVDQNRFFSLRKKIRARWINNHPFFSPGIVFSPFSPNAGK